MIRKIKILINTILLIPFRLLSKISIFTLIENSKIHNTAAIKSGCKIYSSTIGRYTYLAKNCIVTHTKIGCFCSISNNTVISPGNHPLNYISTSPVFYSKNNILRKCFNQHIFHEYKETTIGNDVWIGINCTILGGVKIGNGAVIGSHALVTKDIPPYAIVGGVPAKIIKYRFEDQIISQLQISEWWNFDDNYLKEKGHLFSESVTIDSIQKIRK